MPRTLQIYSDYVCPFCLLAKAPLDEVLQSEEFGDLEIEWMPFELRPFPTPTLRPEDPYLPQIWAQSVYPMAETFGVEIKLPTISPQPYTHLAFEGFQHAKTFGKTVKNAYNERILRAFFVENRDIGDVEVLVELAQEVGAGEGFREALETRRYREAHQNALRHAQEIGVSSVPTFVMGNRGLAGVQSVEALRRFIEIASEEA